MRVTVSTNLTEGYFSQLKRSIDGTYHHVSRKHLQRYLNEFDFRYSISDLDDHPTWTITNVWPSWSSESLAAACRTGHSKTAPPPSGPRRSRRYAAETQD